jgi:hypothetical protein
MTEKTTSHSHNDQGEIQMFERHEERPLSEAQLRYYVDEARLRGKRGELLDLLLDGDWHPNHDCADITVCFHSAIYALRNEGWLIRSRHHQGGTWEYRVVGKTEPPPPTSLMNPQQRRIARIYTDAITTKLGGNALATILPAIPDWMRLDPPRSRQT